MNNIRWRDAVRADLPSILKLWDEQERRFAGTQVRVDRPQLFWEEDETRAQGWNYKPPILRVAEKAGEIFGFRYVEAIQYRLSRLNQQR